jgi:hypothetical protein
MTSDKPPKYNLQVQVNYGTKVTSLKKVAPDTVSTALVDSETERTAEMIRDELIRNILL